MGGEAAAAALATRGLAMAALAASQDEVARAARALAGRKPPMRSAASVCWLQLTAMRCGDMILVDEINLAEDAVLERLNR